MYQHQKLAQLTVSKDLTPISAPSEYFVIPDHSMRAMPKDKRPSELA